jgi:hypothetical protein
MRGLHRATIQDEGKHEDEGKYGFVEAHRHCRSKAKSEADVHRIAFRPSRGAGIKEPIHISGFCPALTKLIIRSLVPLLPRLRERSFYPGMSVFDVVDGFPPECPAPRRGL